MNQERGFLLIEVLLGILILAVGFTVWITVIALSLRVSSRSVQLTEAVLQSEKLLFDLETGNRVDLVAYGGKGPLSSHYRYELQSREGESGFYQLQGRIMDKSGKNHLEFHGYLSAEPVV